MATHSSILALKIPVGKEAFWVTVHGVSESDVTFSLWNMNFFTLLFYPHQEVRPETIKLLEENIDRPLDDINRSKILSYPPSRVMEIKTKVNKWDLIKFKSFCTAKETISKVKRQLLEWEKILANKITAKGLIYKYTSSSYNSISEKQTTQSKSVKKT